MDENGKTVAKGNIISRAGSTGHVLISEKSATIRSRYPGIVSTDGKNSNLEWTAMFSYGSN
jgi:hypothetical protein